MAAISVLVLNIQVPLSPNTDVTNKTPTVTITLYAGEISNNKFGFGTTANNITSPGPTLRFKISDVVNVTLVNAGTMPHAFAITAEAKTGSSALFGATIASSANPLSPGQSRSIVFAPSNAGSFYYICPVPGHAETGMYGSVIITG